MSGPYRTPDGPPLKPTARRSDVAGVLFGLTLIHGIFGVSFLVLTPVLGWVGANGILGMAVRLVGTLVGVAFTWFLCLVMLEGWKGRRGLVAAGALFVGWILVITQLAHRDPELYLLMPRAGAMNLEPLGWVDMILAGQLNAAVSGALAVILTLKPLWTSIEAEKSRLIVANLEPCARCGGRWELDGKLKRCAGCGEETAAPTAEEVRAIRGG